MWKCQRNYSIWHIEFSKRYSPLLTNANDRITKYKIFCFICQRRSMCGGILQIGMKPIRMNDARAVFCAYKIKLSALFNETGLLFDMTTTRRHSMKRTELFDITFIQKPKMGITEMIFIKGNLQYAAIRSSIQNIIERTKANEKKGMQWYHASCWPFYYY